MFEVDSHTMFVHCIDLGDDTAFVMQGISRTHALAVADALQAVYAKGQSDKESEVNAVLREAGLDYPLGIRGVKDLVMQRDGQQARAEEAERDH